MATSGGSTAGGQKDFWNNLPDELQEKILKLEPKNIPAARETRTKWHNMFPVDPVPINAVKFLTSPGNWTVESILEHIDETKTWKKAGIKMELEEVCTAIRNAVESHKGDPLPLVLRALYDLQPDVEYIDENLTIMYVRPIVETLPELAYGFGATQVGMQLVWWDKMSDIVANPWNWSDLAYSWSDNSPGLLFLSDWLKTSGEPFTLGWQSGSSPTEQRELLRKLLAHQFYDKRTDADYDCRKLLFTALTNVEYSPLLESPVHVRDVCV